MTTTIISVPTVRQVGPSLPALVGIELRKSASTRSGRSLIAASVLLGPAAMAVAAATADEISSVTGPTGVVGMLTSLILLSLGVLSTAGEWTHRTVQTTFLLVPHRGRVLAAKAVAMALAGAALAAVSSLLAAAALAVVAGGDVSWTGFPHALVAMIAAGAVFAVTGAGTGAALANSPAALTGLYLVILGVMPVLRGVKPEIGSKLDPAEAVLALAQGHAQTQSALVLAGWVTVAAAAGWTLTRRRAIQ
jgi:ABC-2 type transport system permease protein